MSVSKIDIANMALTHLGMNGITSFTQNNPSAIACNTFFVPTRDEVLGESQWPFARVSEALALTNEEVLGWDYCYLYPVKAAGVWNVYDEATVNKKGEQEFEVVYIPDSNIKVICSNLASAYADYTYKINDTSLYNNKFIMAFSYRLAAAMAHTLTGSAEVGLKLMDIYNALISEAKRISGSEKKKKPNQVSSYQESRG